MRNPPDRVVVDTSIVVKWIVSESDSDRARVLLARWRSASVVFVAPCWFPSELANVLFKHVRSGTLDLLRARRLLDATMGDFALLDPLPVLAGDALAFAHRLDQKAIYDCQFLALADYLDCDLWTADERFWNAAKVAFPRVRWIGEILPTVGE